MNQFGREAAIQSIARTEDVECLDLQVNSGFKNLQKSMLMTYQSPVSESCQRPISRPMSRQSKAISQLSDFVADKSVMISEKLRFMEALPLLKVNKDKHEKPPQCAIKSIKFKQLKPFVLADVGPEYLGQEYKFADKKDFGRARDITEASDCGLYAAEARKVMTGIVYLRDTSSFDKSVSQLTQHDLFTHQNHVDVNELIKDREEASRYEGLDQSSPIMLARKKLLNRTAKLSQQWSLQPQQSFDDSTLQFDSRFESGNLYMALKVSDSEYNLLMQNDINSKGHTQWFFFQVQNTKAGQQVVFNIMNFNKGDSMFNYGMKVSCYSEKQPGWRKVGDNIQYRRNHVRKDMSFHNYYYSLSWTYTFQHSQDVVYFAYSDPYTYTDLRRDLTILEKDPVRCQFLVVNVLCKTLGGLECPIVTITSKTKNQKKAIVLTARQHPGETVGSWMMRGALLFLTDPDSQDAQLLRENYIIKLVPMMNPDGVINGNYRCSLAGCDLNRRWKHPSKVIHPTIYATKKLVKQLHQERGVVLFCDMHGHSRKQNVFMYGCDNRADQEACRMIPYILSKISPLFSFSECRFTMTLDREATARISIFKQLKNVPQVFTLESTFSGISKGIHASSHIQQPLLESIGRDVLRAFLLQQDLSTPVECQSVAEDASKVHQKLRSELREHPFKNESSCGSDSDPSEDNLCVEDLVQKLPQICSTLHLYLKQYHQQKKEVKIRIDLQPCLQKKVIKQSPSPRKIPRAKIKPAQTVAVRVQKEARDVLTQTVGPMYAPVQCLIEFENSRNGFKKNQMIVDTYSRLTSNVIVRQVEPYVYPQLDEKFMHETKFRRPKFQIKQQLVKFADTFQQNQNKLQQFINNQTLPQLGMSPSFKQKSLKTRSIEVNKTKDYMAMTKHNFAQFRASSTDFDLEATHSSLVHRY